MYSTQRFLSSGHHRVGQRKTKYYYQMLHLFCFFVLNIKGYMIHHLDLHSGFMATVYLRNDLTNKYIRKQWFWVPFLVHDISQIENGLKFKPIFYHIRSLPHGLLWHYIQCSKRDVLLVDTLSTQDHISIPSSCYRQWNCNIDFMIRSNFKCVVACVKHRRSLFEFANIDFGYFIYFHVTHSDPYWRSHDQNLRILISLWCPQHLRSHF